MTITQNLLNTCSFLNTTPYTIVHCAIDFIKDLCTQVCNLIGIHIYFFHTTVAIFLNTKRPYILFQKKRQKKNNKTFLLAPITARSSFKIIRSIKNTKNLSYVFISSCKKKINRLNL